ncbi:thiamine-phosphate pyrophosphorylase [Antricoccus suffuscus]|uniref:Thiamine-phosphate synthase n=1 Tax=Antricoccus suffuscus TaxID=1629062 RepID=A0A2T0ZZW5_9ACTN|nr:thiamine phosphate synthase [Antricoccus suffuscus]PRZ41880.1 thiamine-phosphate pyrophosphorylase [Antricoccus suffuscus]
MKVDLSLYLVTDSAQSRARGRDIVDTVSLAVAGGVTAVQIREKTASDKEFLDVVTRVAAALPPTVALFVNDRVEVFLAAQARGIRVSGVHVGQSDQTVSAVRSAIGDDAIIGLSARTDEQLAAAAADPARVDYVGIGTLHPTSTKPDAPDALGIEEFARLASLIDLPAVAIGGITASDMALLRANGAAGAAVVSAICAAEDPEVAARELSQRWNGAE